MEEKEKKKIHWQQTRPPPVKYVAQTRRKDIDILNSQIYFYIFKLNYFLESS
jgi:hypothetical protein